MDRYPISDEESNVHDIISIVLTFLFLTEMIIKMGAYGIKEYSLDRFNLFDSLVVMLSIVDMVIWFA
jgi:voltage-dependent calcium channel T type alpha-1I